MPTTYAQTDYPLGASIFAAAGSGTFVGQSNIDNTFRLDLTGTVGAAYTISTSQYILIRYPTNGDNG